MDSNKFDDLVIIIPSCDPIIIQNALLYHGKTKEKVLALFNPEIHYAKKKQCEIIQMLRDLQIR